jgi:folate-dependent tRNA-U54 methylase TrmFO/GidA
LLPPLPEDVKDKKQKKMHLSSRALVDLKEFLNS